jgi:hypothetical protein
MQMNAGLICNHYGQSKLSQFFFKRQKESIEDPSVELSHGSGTCLPQESKGSGTLSGSKAETNICQRKNKRRWNIPFIFQQKQLLLVVNV